MMKIIQRIIVLVLIIGLIIARVPGIALGEHGFVISGDRNGLEIHVPQKTTDTGNINPGDKKNSSLKLLNTGSRDLTVYIRTNIISDTSPRGGHLADVMTLTIKDGDKIIADGTFRTVADEGNVLIGNMAPETEKTIYFSADLPKGAGNDYQGASLKVNWTFTTQSLNDGGGDEDDDDRDDEDDDGEDEEEQEPPVEVEEEPIPEGEPELPPVEPGPLAVEIPEEEIPIGAPDMPETGEGVHYPFYAVGAFAILAGIGLIKKKF